MSTDTAENRLSEISEMVDAYYQSLNMPEINIDNYDGAKYFDYPSNEFTKMSVDELGEALFSLTKYNIMLQRVLNKEMSKISWCNATLDYLTAKYSDQYVKNNTYVKFEEKRNIIVLNDDYAAKVQRLKVLIDVRIESLKYMPGRIEKLISVLDEMFKWKRLQEKP